MLSVLGVTTAAFLVYGVVVDSPSVSYYVPITVVLVGVIWLIHRSAQFSLVTLWALAAAAIGNLAGGVLLIDGNPLYELAIVGPIKYDKIYHAVATGIGAWASYEAILRWANDRRAALLFVAVMMASGAGAFVEIVEYIGTLIRENTVVGGYSNNMQDLVANTLGAVVGATIAFRSRRLAGAAVAHHAD